MRLSPDEMIFWQHGFLKLNGTIVFTWALMLVLAVGFQARHAQALHRHQRVPAGRTCWKSSSPASNNKSTRSACATRENYIGFLGTLFLFVATGQPLHRHSGYRAADRLALDHGGARAVRFCGRAVFRHRGTGTGRLPQILCRTDDAHAAVQHHQRIVAHARTGGAPVREHDEWDDDSGHSTDHHTIHFPDRDERARSAHRHGAGLHLQHSGSRLHCLGHARAQAEARATHDKRPREDQPENSPWTA